MGDPTNPENPFAEDPAWNTKYCRQLLSYTVPDEFEPVANSGNYLQTNHVKTFELKGSGSCSLGKSWLYLVARNDNLYIKVDFVITPAKKFNKQMTALLKLI